MDKAVGNRHHFNRPAPGGAWGSGGSVLGHGGAHGGGFAHSCTNRFLKKRGRNCDDHPDDANSGKSFCGDVPTSVATKDGVEQNHGRQKSGVLRKRSPNATTRLNGDRSTAQGLSEEEYQLIWEMTKADAKPKDILKKLKWTDMENKMALRRAIHNARQKLIRLFLLEKLAKQIPVDDRYKADSYKTWLRNDPVTGDLNDILFAPNSSLALLRAFPFVLAIYWSYRETTMPVLEVVGFTSTLRNFSVVYGFVGVDMLECYVWALQNVRGLFKPDSLPVVVITCSDPTLIEAVEAVFPEARHLLWRNQVHKDVEQKCIKMTDNPVIFAEFMENWKWLVEAKDEASYEERLCFLELEYGYLPDILSHVKETWLGPYKEKIVSAWTDRVTHFGIHMSSKENMLLKLKRFLAAPTSSFDAIWEDLLDSVNLQLNEILHAHGSCHIKQMHFVRLDELYHGLKFRVSSNGLLLILSETERVTEIGSDSMICGCYLRRTHGLPCAHELSAYISSQVNLSIPLSDIHPFWTLPEIMFNEKHDHDHDLYLEYHIQVFKTKPREEQKILDGCLDKLINPRSSALNEHSHWEKSLGSSDSYSGSHDIAGSSSYSSYELEQASSEHSVASIEFPYPNDIEPFMVQYIQSWTEVEVDGNCGYRAVAKLLKMGETDWPGVRQDCFSEVNARHNVYEKVFGSSSVKTMLGGILHMEGPCRKSQRMPMPDIGYVLATCYQVAVVILSKVQSLTFLPLVASGKHDVPKRVIALAHLSSKDCFIALQLLEGTPIPPLMSSWHSFRDAGVNGWDLAFYGRFNDYVKLKKRTEAIVKHRARFFS